MLMMVMFALFAACLASFRQRLYNCYTIILYTTCLRILESVH